MNIRPTLIEGVYVIERKPFTDERGSFARIADAAEFAEAGLCADFVQANISHCRKKGTLRGMHSQRGDAAEDKLVTCTRGAVYDVCADVRPGSPTFGRYVGETLSEGNNKALYVPKGCAHGFLSLCDNSQVIYMVTQYYTPGAEKGYRYDDPLFNIKWPLSPPYIMTEKDAAWPVGGAAANSRTADEGRTPSWIIENGRDMLLSTDDGPEDKGSALSRTIGNEPDMSTDDKSVNGGERKS
jgi:dTDP-4-dehydrorhamnose 3,5-epimerase